MTPDLIASGLAWLVDELLEHAAREIQYYRGASSATLSAVIGRTEFEVSDLDGNVRIERSDRDYIVRAEHLVVGGARILPARGDRILETHGGATVAYEVAAPAGAPVWKWGDAYRNIVRIHTKQMSMF